MNAIKHFYVLLFTVAIAFTGSAQDVSFKASVSKNRLGINEKLRIDFEMNQDGDHFNPPDFDGFLVVGGPNQAISNSYINGKRSYSKTYSYFLQPQKMGNLTIDQATIEINGQTYKTNTIKLIVTNAIEIPEDPNDPDYVANQNVHLVAELSNSNPYLNEAITVTYKLYVSKDVSITSNWDEVETPKYADFWSQNIDTRGDYKIYEGKYNGEDYRYVVLRSTVLYPQKTGKLTIEPLTLNIPIDVPTRRRDFFGRYLTTRVNKTISAGKRTINVKPFPLEGRPDSFVDAVGDFQFDVRPSKTTLDANESLELKVQISGKGNLKLLTIPQIKVPSSLETYEPERNTDVSIEANGMNGAISENYVVVPSFKGNYPIRPISFSYFDPKTETYKTLTSQEIIVNVPNGPSAADTDAAVAQNNNNTSTNDTFKNIKLSPNLTPIAKTPFFKSTLFWTLVGGPFLLIPLLLVFASIRDRRAADVLGNKTRSANKLARKYLSAAKKKVGDKEPFYEALEKAFHNYLKAKLHLETSEMSKEHIADLLKEKDVSQTTVSSFIALLKSCEFARYTPSTKGAMQEDYSKAAQIISVIDKEMKS